jgi:hypothetical protein
VRSSHDPAKTHASFDDRNLVSRAGLSRSWRWHSGAAWLDDRGHLRPLGAKSTPLGIQLGRPVGGAEQIRLAWLATSIATLDGER